MHRWTKVSLSGTYGHDGLPLSAYSHGDYIPAAKLGDPCTYGPETEDYPGLWNQLHPVPAELQAVFWNGGGHNSSGSEGPAMREWALANIKTLSKLRKVTSGS